MIPRFSPNYGFQELVSCLLPSSNKFYDKIRSAFISHTGHPYGFPFRYGRSGLYYLLKALGAEGKKVIVPSYTCIVVPYAITKAGAIPVFLENKHNDWQPSTEDYLQAIDKDTAMVIPTHLFGICQETKDLYKQIKKQAPHIFVLQDCAHSFFCRDQNNISVSEYGDGCLYGMNISKLVNAVKGGYLTLRSQELSRRMENILSSEIKKLPHYAYFKRNVISRLYVLASAIAFSRLFFGLVYWLVKNTQLLNSEVNYYQHDQVDLPTDFSEPMVRFEAKIAYFSLQKFNKRVSSRKRIAKKYIDVLNGEPSLGLLYPQFSDGFTWSHFPVFLPDPSWRQEIIDNLEKQFNTEIGIIVDYTCGEFPMYKNSNQSVLYSLQQSKSVINLPLTLCEGIDGLSNEQAEQLADRIGKSLLSIIKSRRSI